MIACASAPAWSQETRRLFVDRFRDGIHIGALGSAEHAWFYFAAGPFVGDCWEWTASEFAGYPGFEPFPYREYSEVHFGRGYKVLRGGSWATQPVAIRNTFRNWDLPQRRQIFAGFRCAADV
jgi:formylglycine-generating enzyme required for sulfatase activity